MNFLIGVATMLLMSAIMMLGIALTSNFKVLSLLIMIPILIVCVIGLVSSLNELGKCTIELVRKLRNKVIGG